MSIIVFVEDWNNQYKKASFEAVSYAKSWATEAGTYTLKMDMSELMETIGGMEGLSDYMGGQEQKSLPHCLKSSPEGPLPSQTRKVAVPYEDCSLQRPPF